ncbi:DUF1295 domain-containing protein [Prolixibacteraceae bacterium JC049]|nr:DUF1295 domain-containing protein [Prolixibacteraceae bacterium JC049]
MTLYFESLLLVVIGGALLWLYSVIIKNASIVDLFWGIGFVLVNLFLWLYSPADSLRQLIVTVLVTVWGVRLSAFLTWRNFGKPEDFRYQKFRADYGAHRYWWFSFFQVFLLQGVILWIVALPLAGVHLFSSSNTLSIFDYIGMAFWLVGFIFEAGGDFQMARFKKRRISADEVLNTGLWRYTRHPNYFGDAMIWWGFTFFGIASGFYWGIIGAVLMNFLLVKISGVAMLERTLKTEKPKYAEYIRRTNAFIPWFPKA